MNSDKRTQILAGIGLILLSTYALGFGLLVSSGGQLGMALGWPFILLALGGYAGFIYLALVGLKIIRDFV